MTKPANPYLAGAEWTRALVDFGHQVEAMGLEPSLLELVKLRASQINGCAMCLHMHASAARQAGESELRLYLLDAWRDSSFYTPRERAALGWTEALTRLGDAASREAAHAALAEQFSEADQVKLTLMIVAINGFNRLNIGFQVPHPRAAAQAA